MSRVISLPMAFGRSFGRGSHRYRGNSPGRSNVWSDTSVAGSGGIGGRRFTGRPVSAHRLELSCMHANLSQPRSPWLQERPHHQAKRSGV